MPSQLHANIVRAFAAAFDLVKACDLGSSELTDDVMRLVNGTLRFIEPDPSIAEARLALSERLKSTMLLIDRVVDLGMPVAGSGRTIPAVETARAYAVSALNELRVAVVKHGRVNAAGDQVGLGKAGDPVG